MDLNSTPNVKRIKYMLYGIISYIFQAQTEDTILQLAIMSHGPPPGVGRQVLPPGGEEASPIEGMPVMDQKGQANLTMLLKVIDYSAHKLVKYAKELNDFKVFCIDDQIKLLKGNYDVCVL